MHYITPDEHNLRKKILDNQYKIYISKLGKLKKGMSNCKIEIKKELIK
jgi:hypothetical protein